MNKTPQSKPTHAETKLRIVWVITYKNQGRSEKQHCVGTYQDAQTAASFLRFQGATSIRLRKGEQCRETDTTTEEENP